MERKDLIKICILIIVMVIIVCGTMIYMTSVKDTKLSLKDVTIDTDDKLVFILKDEDGNALKNKTIHVTISNSKNKTKSFNLTTNKKGMAKVPMKNKGKFKVDAKFEGELFLSSSNLFKKVVVKEKYVAPAKSFPYYKPGIGYFRMTGIQEFECAVVEAQNGGYYVIGGDDSFIPYDGVSIDSSFEKYERGGY